MADRIAAVVQLDRQPPDLAALPARQVDIAGLAGQLVQPAQHAARRFGDLLRGGRAGQQQRQQQGQRGSWCRRPSAGLSAPPPPTNFISSVIRLTAPCVSSISPPGSRLSSEPPGMQFDEVAAQKPFGRDQDRRCRRAAARRCAPRSSHRQRRSAGSASDR